MGKLFKGYLIGIVLLVVAIIVVFSLGFEGGEDVAKNSRSDITNEEAAADQNSSTSEGMLTEENFKQAEIGMTYEEVVDVIGTEGEQQKDDEGGGEDTETYTWNTAHNGIGNATFTFQEGELISKVQTGLGEDSSQVTITMDEFERLEEGMTTEEVFEAVGGEGEFAVEGGVPDTDRHIVHYTYYGEGDTAGVATLIFQGDKLTSKAQSGLE